MRRGSQERTMRSLGWVGAQWPERVTLWRVGLLHVDQALQHGGWLRLAARQSGEATPARSQQKVLLIAGRKKYDVVASTSAAAPEATGTEGDGGSAGGVPCVHVSLEGVLCACQCEDSAHAQAHRRESAREMPHLRILR